MDTIGADLERSTYRRRTAVTANPARVMQLDGYGLTMAPLEG